MIDSSRPLNAEYDRLLRRRRHLEVQEADGVSRCKHCGNFKKHHLVDGRCSSVATSQNFNSENYLSLARITRALELIEELEALEA